MQLICKKANNIHLVTSCCCILLYTVLYTRSRVNVSVVYWCSCCCILLYTVLYTRSRVNVSVVYWCSNLINRSRKYKYRSTTNWGNHMNFKRRETGSNHMVSVFCYVYMHDLCESTQVKMSWSGRGHTRYIYRSDVLTGIYENTCYYGLSELIFLWVQHFCDFTF